jgi:probable F420-dependent oxidoreductase
VQIGIVSPVVVQYPGVASGWEATADIADLARVATAADRLGFHHLTCSEHVAVPSDAAEQRGGTYWDPLATLGYLAAVTDQIRLVPQVVVLGYHHPLAIAKRYGTLDRVSGGRLTLGLGVGSLRAEFELLGVPFDDRGARADESLLALRAALSTPTPEFHGTYYDYADVVVEPPAVQPRVPFWIGGRTLRSLRRAVSSGDGWVPFGLGGTELADLLRQVELPPGFDVVLSAGRPLDPIGDPEATRRALARAESLGATITGASITATSADHYCEQLAALRELHPAAPQAQEEQ